MSRLEWRGEAKLFLGVAVREKKLQKDWIQTKERIEE